MDRAKHQKMLGFFHSGYRYGFARLRIDRGHRLSRVKNLLRLSDEHWAMPGRKSACFCNGCVAPDIYNSGANKISKIMEAISKKEETRNGPERLAYSLREAAAMLGVDYFSVYRLVLRGKLKACRTLRGKFLVPRTELLRLLKSE
jgi:excisionase family DNA binding protein